MTKVCRTSGGLLYTVSCATMFASVTSGLLASFGLLFSTAALGPFTNPLFVLPALIVSSILILFGMLRAHPAVLLLTGVGAGLSYTGMSSMFSMATMSQAPVEATLTAWLGILLIGTGYLINYLQHAAPANELIRLQTTTAGSQYSTSGLAESTLVAPFVLALISGVLIIVGAALVPAMGFLGMMTMMGTMHMDMSGMGTMGAMPVMSTVTHGVHLASLAIGVSVGILVLLSGILLYARPGERPTWAALILAFSLLSLLSGGGFLIGLILGVVAGALALAAKPSPIP